MIVAESQDKGVLTSRTSGQGDLKRFSRNGIKAFGKGGVLYPCFISGNNERVRGRLTTNSRGCKSFLVTAFNNSNLALWQGNDQCRRLDLCAR